jgi:hypothetical protein
LDPSAPLPSSSPYQHVGFPHSSHPEQCLPSTQEGSLAMWLPSVHSNVHMYSGRGTCDSSVPKNLWWIIVGWLKSTLAAMPGPSRSRSLCH